MEKHFEYKERYSRPTNACLNLTDDCNLACRYCFVAQQPHYMTLDIAKRAVEWLISNLNWQKEHGLINKNETITLTYFGGEPTLMWDKIIVPLTRWCWETYPKLIDFSITTNGTLLNEDRIKFLYAYNIYPLLSIDGAYETQEYNRPCKDPNLSSAELQYKNIPTLLKYFPNTTFRSTIDEHTVSHTFENYIFAQCMGFKNIFMMPNCRTPWKEENLQILTDEFKKIYSYMVEYFERNELPPIDLSPVDRAFEQIKKYNINVLNKYTDQGKPRPFQRCGLGTTSCSIGYDGKIYGCQEQDSKGENSHFYIGDLNNVSQEINYNLHSKFLEEYYNSSLGCGDKPEYCDNCPLSIICEDLHCPSASYDLFNDFGKDSYVHCYWQRSLYEQAITVLKYLKDNPTFRKYLKNQCNYDFLKEGENNGSL